MQGTASIPESFIKPGDIVAGKYKIVRILGEGGMGVVVEALHQALDQRVAIKFHRQKVGGGSDSVARFLREAKSAAQIRSEHVVRVTDVAVLEDGDPYFVMEYLEGQDLDSVIQSDGPLSIPLALDYTLQVCEALAEAHALGIVHRDLKPANLFLAKRADGSVVIKLLDFGISKMVLKGTDAELSMTKTRALMGSPLYMAPEQMRSTRRVDHRADLWSLGVLVHEILTAETPFLGETLPEVCASIAADDPIPLRAKRPEAPPELEEVILRCLEKDPEHRFADVADFALALAPIAPPEAERSIARIVRILRGQLTPTIPPSSIRPSLAPRQSTPFAAILPSVSDPNADTMCIEPSDQKRSGVAAKQRIRKSAPDPHRALESVETVSATSPSFAPPSVIPESQSRSGARKRVATVAIALAVGAAAALLLTRPHAAPNERNKNAEARAASSSVLASPPSAPNVAPEVAKATLTQGKEPAPNPGSAEPTTPTTIEFVDVPNPLEASHTAAPPSSAALAHSLHGPRNQSSAAKADHGDSGAAPGSPSNANAPAPSGTAAFGAARD
jgi:eukaryotic-like serine/threonine-protein kinase